MTVFTAPSGAEVAINPAGWVAAKRLKMALERELAQIANPFTINAVMMIDSSELVDTALWPCLNRCLYKGEKITEQTFDKPEARGDYYEVIIACVKENLGPLAESLRSKLIEHGLLTQANTEKGQKSASATS